MSETLSTATNEARLNYLGHLSATARARAETSGAVRAATRAAKENGINTRAASLVARWRKMDRDAARAEVLEVFRFAWLAGVVGRDQLDALAQFDNRVSNSATQEWLTTMAEEAGWQAGLDGQERADNPYNAGTEEYAVWERLRRRAVALVKVRLGPEGEPAPSARAQPRGRSVREAGESLATAKAAATAPRKRRRTNGATEGEQLRIEGSAPEAEAAAPEEPRMQVEPTVAAPFAHSPAARRTFTVISEEEPVIGPRKRRVSKTGKPLGRPPGTKNKPRQAAPDVAEAPAE